MCDIILTLFLGFYSFISQTLSILFYIAVYNNATINSRKDGKKRDSQNVRIFHPSKMENKKSSRQVCCVEIRNERIIFEKIERKTKVNRENIIT